MSTDIQKKVKEIEITLQDLAVAVHSELRLNRDDPVDLSPRGISIAPARAIKARYKTIRITATYMLYLPKVRIHLVFESAAAYIPPTGPQIYSIPLEDVEFAVRPPKQPGCYHKWVKVGKEYTCEVCGKTIEPSEF